MNFKQATANVLFLSVIQRGALQTHCLQHCGSLYKALQVIYLGQKSLLNISNCYLLVHCNYLLQGFPTQYDFTIQYNPWYSMILNRTKYYKFPNIVRVFALFSQKTAFLKVHFMYLVLVLAQYHFLIARFPGSTKFILYRDHPKLWKKIILIMATRGHVYFWKL